ncbi:mucoidy inhibitor MuiA family protein [Gramella jeungdoensis]|uniref:Mucoidy inhibitor MuiA family protein n=1 Tax=Gramella jeungdoensis TaxID=708091 RepID=A0ABT0Z2N6_9FLAO|nr:mucoidy inhibitor MuiA family protein [Gramella jeungdoensis]MCM8569991.1 mucoidy inhibitor MuiA family protein [Gramella jeungdoensis]
MKKYLLCVLMISTQVFSQTYPEKNLNTKITDVTVFLQGAQVTRKGETRISSGETKIILENLSPFMDDKSVQVKAEGDFTVISVKHKLDYLNEREKSNEIDSLQERIENIESQIALQESRLQVLAEKESLLDKNKDLNGETSGASLTQLKQAIEFYDRELSQIKKEGIITQQLIENLNEQKTKISRQIADINLQEDLPSGKIEIRVESDISTSADFRITYLVENAGWYPNYDLRVKDIESPLTLNYKADVYQNTGVDWENVNLKLSNGNPNESGVAPELETWYLNYARNTIFKSVYDRINPNVANVKGKVLDEDGLPLPGVNVIVKGSTVGTQTDFDGNYELTLPNNAKYLVYSYVGYKIRELPISQNRMDVKLETDQALLEEVVVTAYGGELQGKAKGIQIRGTSSANTARRIETTAIENQTTVEFKVDKPYSIPSTGEKLAVDLTEYEIETHYEYYSVPKLDNSAYILAKITDWDKYNLLEGEANLFFEDAFVGRSVLDAKSLSDTLSISLGKDRNIVIGREKIDEFSKRRTIGSNKIETREFRILARNKKSQPIQLTLFDQIPVPAINEIDVDEVELTNGKLNEKTGEITWTLNLKPEEQKELILKYEVKYPKHEKVLLE